MFSRICLLVIVLLLSHSGAFAQKTGAAPRLNPVLIPTTKPVTSVGPSTTPLYVTGKVLVSDGGELPPNVVIEKVCGSRRSALGYTDHKGNFDVRLSGNSLASLVDASDDSRSGIGNVPSGARDQGGANLMGCTLQAMYAGYRSDSLEIGSRRNLDNPDVGTIVLRRIGGGSGTMVSATMLAAPKSAVKSYEHGLDAVRKGDLPGAKRHFEKAVELHPAFANAWFELGRLQMTSDPDAARASLEKSIAADPKYVLPFSDLAVLAYRRKDWAETIRISERGLRLDSSGSPLLYYFNAAAQFNSRNLDEAEKKVREAIKFDTSHSIPKAPQLLSYILGNRGDFVGAAEQMRVYLATESDPAASDRGRKELAQMEARADAGQKK